MQFIADTGFIAGFWDRNDKVREWARRIARDHPGPHLTCEPALVEACYLAGTRRVARAFAHGDYIVDFRWEPKKAEILELLERYADLDMDVTDACIVLLAEQNPRLKVLTVDQRDFAIYRTSKGKPVACIFPPN